MTNDDNIVVPKQKIKLVKKVNDKRIKSSLLPHQTDFLATAQRMEREGHGGLNGSEMGTGKTLMMLGLHSCASTEDFRSTLVVCPSNLLDNWEREGKKHIHGLKQVRFHGPKRYNLVLSNYELVLTTYDTLRLEWEKWGNESPLRKWCPQRIVLDEAHEIKNPKTKKHAACMWIGEFAKTRWCVTGTPIQNSHKDLLSLMEFIGWKKRNIEEWKKECYVSYKLSELQLQLPNKVIEMHNLELEEKEMEGYRELKETIIESYEGGERFLVILTKILRLRQYCNKGVKWRKVLEILRGTKAGDKTIIFSQFVETLQELKDVLTDYDPLIYHGDLKANQKQAVLTEFEKGDSKVLLMSLKAGGVGLNMVMANQVIMYEPWWNVSVEEQAWARVHRLGQIKPVTIHRFKVKNTIEEWLFLLQDEKKEQCAILGLGIGQTAQQESIKTTISKEKLQELFRNACY